MSSSRKLSSETTKSSESMTSNNSNSASEKTKKENKKKEEFSDDENEEPECTPEKEQVNEGMLPKSPHKSALKPLELRLAARFGPDSPRRKSISFANEEEFQVKLIPKNKTGTPEVTCMINESLEGKWEKLKDGEESWGCRERKRERKPSRISFTCNKTTSASTTTPTSSGKDQENSNNKKPRRSSVSFKPACSDDDTTPTKKSGEESARYGRRRSHIKRTTPT